MSVKQLWGTGIAPEATLQRRRITSAGDVRVTSQGDVRVATIPSPQVIFLRTTSVGDQRVTKAGERRITIDGLLGPQYFQTDNVPTDGGEQFEFRYITNAWQPPDEDEGSIQGSETLFIWADVALSWSMSATVRLSALVDGEDDAIALPNGDSLEHVPSTFTLPQQAGNLNRLSRVFTIPLVRRIVRGGVEVARWYLRGERLQILLESTGPLGVGELQLDGIEVEFESVQKAEYAPVVSA